FRYGVGARIVLDELVQRDGVSVAEALFSESQGRVLVSVPRSEDERFTAMLAARQVPFVRVGVTQDTAEDEQALDIQDQFRIPLAAFKQEWEATLPQYFG